MALEQRSIELMGKALYVAAVCAFSSQLFSLEEAPWVGNMYECQLYTDFVYSQYRKISHAQTQPSYAYNNYVNDFSIVYTATEKIDLEVELNMARTPHQTYGFRSAAFQARWALWDDVEGDCISVNAALNTRAVGGRSVRDVSSPYASYWNGEATLAVGKEFTLEKDVDWKTRGYLFGSVGLANHGSFWNRYKVSFEARFLAVQTIELFSLGYFGYGSEKDVDIEQFQGWGSIRHRSIDIGGRYSHQIGLYGALSFSYACRVWAHSYPEGEQKIEVSYKLPFSIF